MSIPLISKSIIRANVSLTAGFSNRSVMAMVIVVLLVVMIVGFWRATPVVDLGINNNFENSTLHDRWSRGEVVVMIRHAERCDRSSNPCMGSADGITVNGSHAARAVGAGLQQLGLDNAQMIASPLTRTRQTGDLVLGHAMTTQHWVSECDTGFKDAVLAHKMAGQNLVLITHSGCIDQFERKMGVRAGDRSSEYTQTLFVAVDGQHAPDIIGSLDAAQWGNMNVAQVSR